nr:hypothetical protein [Tanacetum cinerariifolium]
MSGTIPPIPPPFGASSGNLGGFHVTNVPAFDKEDFTSWKVRFLVFLDGLEPYLLKTLEDKTIYTHLGHPVWQDNYKEGLIDQIYEFETQRFSIQTSSSKALISNHQSQDSDSDVKEDHKTNNEFMADLNAEYHERDLLANQKRFYKRSGRVGSARKPLDKTKETCFACRKLGYFQKDCPSHKTSTPSYPSSNNSLNKSKPYTLSFIQTSSQNPSNRQKDYKGKYKGLKAEMAILTKRIDDMTKGKREKGKKDQKKSENGLLAESFDWDNKSVSLDDEGSTKIRHLWQFKVTLDQLLSEKVPRNIVKALGGKGRRKEKISSKQVVFTKANESLYVLTLEITSDSKSKCDSQEPLPPLLMLIGATPSGTSERVISLCDLTLNIVDLTLDTEPNKTKPYGDSSTGQLLLTLTEEVKGLKRQIEIPTGISSSSSQSKHDAVKKTLSKLKARSPLKPSPKKAPMIPKPFIECKYYRFNDHHSDHCEFYPGYEYVVVLHMKNLTVLRNAPTLGDQGLPTGNQNPLKSRFTKGTNLCENVYTELPQEETQKDMAQSTVMESPLPGLLM